jgi:prevent-host-death family protein
MRRSEWSVQEAKDKLSAVMKAAKSTPQTITKHGKPDTVVVAVEEFARLKRIEKAKKPSFVDLLLAMPKDDGEFERVSVKTRDIEF